MNSQNPSASASEATKKDPQEAAQALGKLLRHTREYEEFLTAFEALNIDPTAQLLRTEIRVHQSAIQWGRDPDGQHAAELSRLETEQIALPVVQAYLQAEKAVRAVFRQVDQIISQEAGVPFAANARRSGCCG